MKLTDMLDWDIKCHEWGEKMQRDKYHCHLCKTPHYSNKKEKPQWPLDYPPANIVDDTSLSGQNYKIDIINETL